MSYYGEKGNFSFRDNFCEETDKPDTGELAKFGETLGKLFRRIAVCTDVTFRNPELYILAGGIARSGADVFVMKDVMPVFRYGIKLAECDCGVYLCGDEKLKIIFFDGFGINMPSVTMEKIYKANSEYTYAESGKISMLRNISELYINSVRDKISGGFKGNAVISCGNRRITDIWKIFFNSDKGDIIFQISVDGSRVNCYSTEFGFISYEKLILAYAVNLVEKGETVVLPDIFQYAAAKLPKNISERFIYQDISNHERIYRQRFTYDTLFLCTELMNSGKRIPDIIRNLPEFYTAKREIVTDLPSDYHERTILASDGKIKLSRSGKNRLTVTAQSMSMETSAELCCKWERFILEKKGK